MQSIQRLVEFIKSSPTAWHAVKVVSQELEKKGFRLLDEGKPWKLKPGQAYYIVRNGSSLIAFVTPKKDPQKAVVCASHTDSPALKLKPNAAYIKEGMLMFGVEVYGSPLLNSWLNRDLGIAGRVISESLVEKLVMVDHAPLVIPQLAIHFDKELNTHGLILNRQDHLAALGAIGITTQSEANKYFHKLLGVKDLISSDLFLYPLEPPAFVGPNKEMLAAYRIDSLCSVHAITSALTANPEPLTSTLKMCVLWDNEEIGSETAHGAASPFFAETLERILLSLSLEREDYLQIIPSSLCISVDLGHAVNPNYADKHEPNHKNLLGNGIIIKHSANQRYASNARTAAFIKSLCHKQKIPCQDVVSRSDLSPGTTVGPIHANSTGMPTVDIGIAQLSMHSARELVCCQDHENMIALLGSIYAKESYT